MAELFTWEALSAFVSLAALEIVLGIDNIVFIAIVTSRLDPGVQARARRLGLLAAMGMRIVLLLGIAWIMELKEPILNLLGWHLSGKDLILISGGLFLIAKAAYELHHKLDVPDHPETGGAKKAASFSAAIVQIMMIDMVFSLDSVITAVGMTNIVPVMIAAVVAAVLVMLVFANPVANFVEQHPTLKVLALSFLLLIGVLLFADGFHQHIPRGYIYFAMGFALGVELLNMRLRKVSQMKINIPQMPETRP